MTAPTDQAVSPGVGGFFRELTAAGLLPPGRAQSVLANFGGAGVGGGAATFAEFLVQGGLLSTYQAEQALNGQAARLALGPYLLVEPVGSGSLGTVYRAVHKQTRRRFAVKQLPLRNLWNVLQAKRQVQTFAALAPHPAVVPFVDIDTAGGSHYLVWPFVEGETFENLVKRAGPLPPSLAVRLVTQVLDGLAACHKVGVVHGLLKPSNLLLGPDRKSRVLDFGIGAILTENIADDESLIDTISTANVAMNMIDCTPPEVFENAAVRTPAGDLYSLGCTLHYMLTGAYPFPGGNIVDKMIAHQTQEPPQVSALKPTVPQAVSDLVGRMLRKAPGDRPADLRQLIAAFHEAIPDLRTQRPASQAVPLEPIEPDAPPLDFSPPDGGSIAALVVDEAETIDFDLLDSHVTPRDSGARPRQATVRPNFDAPATDGPIRKIVLRATPPDHHGKAPGPARGNRRGLPSAAAEVTLPPTSINWAMPADDASGPETPPVATPIRPKLGQGLWDRFRRLFSFAWTPRDVIQFSVFGPPRLAPGQTYEFQVYAHPPESFASVRTISRAFSPDTDLLGSDYGRRLVLRGTSVGLHLAVGNAGVAKSLVRVRWVGQSKPWTFEVYVPWESPAGRTPGVLNVGLGQVQIGRIPFDVTVLPRST